MMRMTIFRSDRLVIAMVGAMMAPTFNSAAAQQPRAQLAIAPAEKTTQARAAAPTIRPGEFYAAPYLERAAGPANAGRIVGTGDVPSIPLTESERPLQSNERIFVTVPPGMASASGTRYVTVRPGRMMEGVGLVMIPTGIVTIERAQPGQAAEARIVARFAPMQIGDQLVTMESVPANLPRPTPVAGGAITRVLWISSEPVLPSLQSYVVVGAASGMRMGDQITFFRERRTTDTGVVLPESNIGVAQIVRVTPQGASALVIDQSYGAIAEGTAARVTAKMP